MLEGEHFAPANRQTLTIGVTLALMATIALFGVSVIAPASLDLGLLAYLLLLAVLAVGVAIRLITSSKAVASDRPFLQALRPSARQATPPEAVLALRRQITFAMSSADDLHYRLRPLLLDLARERLAARRNVALDTQPERAEAALGPVAWALLRPDRPRPRDRHGRGADLPTLAAVVTALEEI